MLNALKGWEGLRTTAYKCAAGVWTIGYGHTGNVSPGQTISEAQAEQYLRQDLSSFENEVTSLAKNVGVKLTQGQYDALVSFFLQLWWRCVKKSGILEMLKGGNIDGAASKLKQYVHGGRKGFTRACFKKRNRSQLALYIVISNPGHSAQKR